MTPLLVFKTSLLFSLCQSLWVPSFRHSTQPSIKQSLNAQSSIPRHNIIIQSSRRNNFIRLHMSTANNNDMIYSDEEYEELLDEMIYSGDFVGFMRRKTKEIVSEDFLEFLQEREKNAEDIDDKNVLNEIMTLINDKLRLSDGMLNSESVFDERLDKILYTAPNKRLQFVEEIKDDLTDGFITHVKRLLASDKDIDNKVVFASILQLISQVKGSDYLGTEAVLLSRADASLGEQFAKTSGGLITDEGMVGGSGGAAAAGEVKAGERNEQILAGLLFSQNDVLEDVLNNVNYLDDEFVKFLESKVDKCNDMDERMAMSSLLQTINYVRDRIKEAQTEGATEETDNEELSIDQVKQRMREVQAGQTDFEPAAMKGEGGKNKPPPSFKEFAVKKESKDTFQIVLDRFLSPPDASMSFEQLAEINYDLCDLTFMEMLKKEAADCYAQGATAEGDQYQAIGDALNNVMVKRISTAQERLQQILSKRALPAMEGEVIRMCRKGEMDEALILLIEANAKQAEDAGAIQASEVLKKLSKRIAMENDRKLPDEQRLLRVLMKEAKSDKRKEYLFEAFKPAKSMNEDGGVVNGPPLISPPVFIQMLRTLITNYGNVEGFDIFGKAQILIDEAQVVATDLYGEGMSPREQQQYMFEKKTVSVWDLAEYENMAVMSGDEVPWRNDQYDGKMPDEVLGERVRRVGGNQEDGIM